MTRSKKKNGLSVVEEGLEEGLLANKMNNTKKQLSNKCGEGSEGENTPAKKTGSAWSGMLCKIKLLWPYMWPVGHGMLQLRALGCVIILLVTRVLTVLVPIYQKKIVDSMTIRAPELMQENSTIGNSTIMGTSIPTMLIIQGVQFRWDYILIYIFLKTLHGNRGWLGSLRSLLWFNVSCYTRRKLRVQLFHHLHHLSLRWHLQRKTGEVLRVMDRGVNSVNLILSQILFNLLPVIADILIAIIFFTAVFNVWIGLIIFVTMLGYAVSTVLVSEWRTKYRRDMNQLDNAKSAASVDSILNFETVKYYAAEDYEVNRYAESVDKYLAAEWLVNATMNLLNFLQQAMMSFGLLGGSLLCAWYVYEGDFTVGDYILFASYVAQMYAPLNMLGMIYRQLQQAFVDMENMFDILSVKQEVVDEPNAQLLEVSKGQIEFKDVSFYYNEHTPILKHVNFTVPPGQVYALVGPSGGGKSTIIRLILRFYDVQSGSIFIDQQDIQKVKQKSVRDKIGVVPQDTVLFNNDVSYNIRYGRVTATDDEIERAAKAADIHNKIISLPTGYGTKVGERGLKLSGGEKQRVAIARTLLKAPQIVLLDEATSALDTRTERNIQCSLANMCQDRTTLVVAHRLSTIINADMILVMKGGEIVERGRHDELLSRNGEYTLMWNEQLQAEAAEVCDDSSDQVVLYQQTDQPAFTDHIPAVLTKEKEVQIYNGLKGGADKLSITGGSESNDSVETRNDSKETQNGSDSCHNPNKDNELPGRHEHIDTNTVNQNQLDTRELAVEVSSRPTDTGGRTLHI